MKKLMIAAVLLAAFAAFARGPMPAGWDLDRPVLANYAPADTPFDGKLQVVAFNIERGLFWQDVVSYINKLREQNPATVVLLIEADRNHSRTGDIFVADEMARALGMNLAYVTEFIEYNDETKDSQGDHGNAVLSPFPMEDITAIRHTTVFDWEKNGHKQGEPRYGERVTVAATIVLPGGKKVRVYSVHLESNALMTGKWVQMKEVLADADAKKLPAVIGGDFNELPGMLMFTQFPLRGVKNAFAADLHPTGSCKPGDGRARCLIKIDWIVYRGLDLAGSAVDYPLNSDGGILSDHAPVRAEFRM